MILKCYLEKSEKMIKYSIIVPVYNAEKTLRRCLESIRKQTYKNFEVIIVNDGAIDKSEEIANEYREIDSRFIVITQINKGVSSARNTGLELISGEYVSFVDSDDYLTVDYLGKINEVIKEERSDIVFYGVNHIDRNGNIIKCSKLPEYTDNYLDNIVTLSREDMFGYAWIKIYRTSLLQNLRYEENISLFEDELFTCTFFLKERKISYINDALYNYVHLDGSLSKKNFEEYSVLCDMVYSAWKKLLDIDVPFYSSFLVSKANHMALISKYYGLEKSKKPFIFYLNMAKTSYIRESTINDSMINDIRNNRIFKAILRHFVYNVKNKVKGI